MQYLSSRLHNRINFYARGLPQNFHLEIKCRRFKKLKIIVSGSVEFQNHTNVSNIDVKKKVI